MGTRTGRLYACDGCGQLVWICSHCDRGNRYCGEACSHAARKRSKREAARRYQKSELGRRNQRRRQERYRIRQASRSTSTSSVTKVTHQGSDSKPSAIPPPSDLPEVSVTRPISRERAVVVAPGSMHCSRCGRRVSEHLRVSFLSGEDPG